MIDINRKYQTRDGRAVEILRTGLYCDSPFNVLGIIWKGDGKCIVEAWTPEGETTHDSIVYDNDLIPVPTKHEGYIVVGKDGFVWGQGICSTPEDAMNEGFKQGDHLAHVTWED